MLTVRKALTSTVGRKFIMGASGLLLVGFLFVHIATNLLLYAKTGESFNAAVARLWSLGSLVYLLELGLAALFASHIVVAITLKRGHREARPDSYRMSVSKGTVHNNPASRNMAVTGIILLVFLILHILQFRFGPGISEGYSVVINGKTERDLYRVVTEAFKNPIYVALYVAVMLFLGSHLRHGFWSAFQSLGVLAPRISKVIYALGFCLAFVLAAAFLFIPIWIYFDLGAGL
ncbi:MAG: succinate dehydrogenase cytochrome b subunit [Oligoflexia bacterium]|nr:succinate dehydrogenase cytochrome b subunit [Oligoflexia bacterium]